MNEISKASGNFSLFIESEVENYNKALMDDVHFTVAIGCSFLRENGIVKNITKWKEEADFHMYEDKKRKKFQEVKTNKDDRFNDLDADGSV